MTRIALNGGFYQAKSVIANAQNCINLYAEVNQPDAPVKVTTYLTPGLTLLSSPPVAGISRGNYRASNGDFYRVVGPNIYFVNTSWVHTLVGTMANLTSIVSFADNSLAIIIVDGSTAGYVIDMKTRQFGTITSVNFYGADKVDYLDTFFIFNRPGTNQFYISASEPNYVLLAAPLGSINTGEISNVGSGYVTGTYFNAPLIGGSGTGAQATIVVTANKVSSVTITAPGINYLIGDQLSVAAASVGGSGTGFVYTVDSIGGNAFDPLDLAGKVAYSDLLATLIVMHQEIWLLGFLTTEIWYNSGAADFTFQQMPQGYSDHGIAAIYSLCEQDNSTYWLSQDRQGQVIVMRGAAYTANRISTHAIENEFMTYPTIKDAIGFIYQQEGHVFYFLTFPSANKTWVYDQATELWHQRAWTDAQGNLNRHRVNCGANVYGQIAVGDWQNGNLYSFDLNNYTDNGAPISRIRSFPHAVTNSNRISYSRFIADMDVGQMIDPSANPQISLRWSDDKGVSYSNALEQSLGKTGQYRKNLQWQRLGMARDRVFELSWSANAKTALQGSWIEIIEAAT